MTIVCESEMMDIFHHCSCHKSWSESHIHTGLLTLDCHVNGCSSGHVQIYIKYEEPQRIPFGMVKKPQLSLYSFGCFWNA